MYIRRKVFSKIGEKTFSTTEFQTQKEFAAKKEESKKEKVAKAATIGGATVGLGAGAVGLNAEIGLKKKKDRSEKKITDKEFSELDQKEFAVKPKISRKYFKKLGENRKSLEPLSEERLIKAGRKLSEKEQLPRGLNASINIKKAGDVERNKKVIKATKEYPHLRFTKDAYLP